MLSMRRVRKRPPTPCRPRILVGHALSANDPVMADSLGKALSSHVSSRTQANYDSAARSFVRFCSDRELDPFPVDPVLFAAFVVYEALWVSVPSVKAYMSAVRSAHIDCGFVWDLDGNQTVYRAYRYIKRRYGVVSRAPKAPLSLKILLRFFDLIAGWPNPDAMSHDDRLFVTASILATLGFLRGGEFLSSPSSARPILRADQVVIGSEGGKSFVEVRIACPKARWWIQSESATCFATPDHPSTDPIHWLRAYRSLAPVHPTTGNAAFFRSSGETLSRNWMVSRTHDLLSRAGISIRDSLGNPVKVLASSWRAGGVQSARDAGLWGGRELLSQKTKNRIWPAKPGSGMWSHSIYQEHPAFRCVNV